MSMASYQNNLELGVTGPGTYTCFTGALEQISPRHKLHPEQHLAYQEFALDYNAQTDLERYIHGPDNITLINKIVRSLGKLTFEDLKFACPQSLAAFTRFVNKAMEENCRVVVDIEFNDEGDTHSMGLVPTKWWGEYKLVSTWLPEEFQGIVTTADLFPHLAQPDDIYVPKRFLRRYLPTDDANVMALPPRAA